MTELTRLEKLVNVAVEREDELQEVSVKYEKLATFLGDDIFVISEAYMFSLERRLDGYASVMACLEFEIAELDVPRTGTSLFAFLQDSTETLRKESEPMRTGVFK